MSIWRLLLWMIGGIFIAGNLASIVTSWTVHNKLDEIRDKVVLEVAFAGSRTQAGILICDDHASMKRLFEHRDVSLIGTRCQKLDDVEHAITVIEHTSDGYVRFRSHLPVPMWTSVYSIRQKSQ